MYKAIIGTHAKSWERETDRLELIYGKDKVSIFSFLTENHMVHYAVMHIFICWSINMLFGVGGLTFQAYFSFLGIFWLEMNNLLEHYGLERWKDENGVFEAVGSMHSWNSVSSHVGFRIQRHSDHHAHLYRPYQVLRKFDKAPFLPYEHVLMILLVLCPPMFNYIMDPRVQAINDARNGIENKD